MTINARIKDLRKTLGLTQIDFGSKIGIVQGHLTAIESGKRRVTEKTIKVICSSYGASEDWLRTGKGEMFTRIPNEKAERAIKLFTDLPSEFQDYILHQMKKLLEIHPKDDT